MTYFNSLKIMSLNCDAKKEEEKPGEKKHNKKISLKIHVDLHVCTKQGVNLRMRCGNDSPE